MLVPSTLSKNLEENLSVVSSALSIKCSSIAAISYLTDCLQLQRYRKLALEKHPDKQPGNKRAAEEFIKLQRAFEILSDDKAREAWDNLQR